MGPHLSPVIVAGLGLAGLAAGPALASLARRLPGDASRRPDPFPGRHALAAAVAGGVGAAAGLLETSWGGPC